MKVIYYHQHFSTRDGATGTRSFEFASALIKAGHQVTMVCGSFGAGRTGLEGPFIGGLRRGTVSGIEIIEFALPYSNRDGFFKRTKTFLVYSMKSARLALTEKYDVLFATSTPLTAAIPGIVATVIKRGKFVFEVRDLWPELPSAMGVIRNPLILAALSALEWMAYHTAKRLVGLSPGIVAGICRRGIDDGRVTMIPNGCDIEDFDAEVEDAWRPPGVAPNDFMAVFTGTHGYANGVDAILAAGAELRRRGRQGIKLVMIGDGALKAQLVEQAARERLANCVFHEPVAKTRLSGLLRAADAGLMVLANVPAFYYGTSPNKFFDYIAAGLPVLNNYPGWLAGMIADNQCGIAVPPDNPRAFADALERMADDRHALAEMGRRGRQLAEREFDRRQLSRRFVVCLEEVSAQ